MIAVASQEEEEEEEELNQTNAYLMTTKLSF